MKQCGLCGLEFEEHNLPGVVSFQAIANLRAKYVDFLLFLVKSVDPPCHLDAQFSPLTLRSFPFKLLDIEV